MDPVSEYGRPVSKKRRVDANEQNALSHPNQLSDRDLVELSVRELNRIVSNLPPHQIKVLKYKRRTLKNRGYASNCRVRRLSQKDLLTEEKKRISVDSALLRRENEVLREQLESLKEKSRALIEFQRQHVPLS